MFAWEWGGDDGGTRSLARRSGSGRDGAGARPTGSTEFFRLLFLTSGLALFSRFENILLRAEALIFKMVTLLDLCVSSLRRGHANLLCIVPILSYETGFNPLETKMEPRCLSSKQTAKIQTKKRVFEPRIELGTFCVLGRRDNQLHHPNATGRSQSGILNFLPWRSRQSTVPRIQTPKPQH